MISIVACCHSAKLCAYAARDFLSQQYILWLVINRLINHKLGSMRHYLNVDLLCKMCFLCKQYKKHSITVTSIHKVN